MLIFEIRSPCWVFKLILQAAAVRRRAAGSCLVSNMTEDANVVHEDRSQGGRRPGLFTRSDGLKMEKPVQNQ